MLKLMKNNQIVAVKHFKYHFSTKLQYKKTYTDNHIVRWDFSQACILFFFFLQF